MSDRSMTVIVEVWPVAADPSDAGTGYPGGLWLLGPDAWRSGPVAADSAPHIVMEDMLAAHEVTPLAPHSTSWRPDCDTRLVPGLAPGAGEAAVVLTYVVPIKTHGLVLDSPRWLEVAQPISPALAAAVGKPSVVAVTEAPRPRRIDVLLHGLRHLALLARGVGADRMGLDATYRAALDPAWIEHLAELEPALATLYVPAAA